MARASPPLPPDPGCLVGEKAIAMEEAALLLLGVESLPSMLFLHLNSTVTPSPSGTFALRASYACEAPARVGANGLGIMSYRCAPRFRLAAGLLHCTFPDEVLRPYVALAEQELGRVGASANLRQEQACPPTESRKEDHMPTYPSYLHSAYVHPEPYMEPLLTGNCATRIWSTVDKQQPGALNHAPKGGERERVEGGGVEEEERSGIAPPRSSAGSVSKSTAYMARASPPLPPDPGCLVAEKAIVMEERVFLLPGVESLPSMLIHHLNSTVTPSPTGPFALHASYACEAPARVVANGLGTMSYRCAPRFRLAAVLLHGMFPYEVLRPYVALAEQELGCVSASANLRQEQACPPTESRKKEDHLPTYPSYIRSAYVHPETDMEPLLTGNCATRIQSTVDKQQPGPIMSTQEMLDSMNGIPDTNVPNGADDSSKKQKHKTTQFFVKLSGHTISMQQDTSVMTVQSLVDWVCEMKGYRSPDWYSVYAGKTLDGTRPLAHYAICKDSTVEIRTRGRGGRPDLSTQEALDSMNGITDTSSNLFYRNVPKGADSSNKHKYQPTQFFVKLSGHTISVQQDTGVMTVQRLVDRVCEMKGHGSRDCYAVYAGKTLDGTRPLAHYDIGKDCTVEIRTRGRGGRQHTVNCRTFSEMMMGRRKFRTIRFPHTLTNYHSGIRSATFLSGYMQWFARQILITLCRMHARGKSLNGAFDSSHIFFHGDHVIFDEALVEVDFTAETCKADYKAIEKIFSVIFLMSTNRYPLFVKHLLEYLSDCPAGISSNSEACIAFLIRHPALTAYTDRMAQCTLLDSMVARLNHQEFQKFLNAVGGLDHWEQYLVEVQSMRDTYCFGGTYDSTGAFVVFYDNDSWGCLHYSRNYFKHASLKLQMEKIEAAFCANVPDFLANVLKGIAVEFQGPPTFDIVALLGNYVADNQN